MSSNQPQNQKPAYKAKYEANEKTVTKFGFVFDQEKVSFKTQIPEVPSKLKPRPDEKVHLKKVGDVETKLNALKEDRKKKKDQYKNANVNVDDKIIALKRNVDLGNKCLIVLRYDLEDITNNIADVEGKIQKKFRFLRNLQRGPRDHKQERKEHEQMTFEELEVEIEKLSTRVSTANLSKKEESDINSLITKLNRIKMNAPHGERPKDNTAEIENAQESLNRIKKVKENILRQQNETVSKISAVEEDVEEYENEIKKLEGQKKNKSNQTLYEQSQKLKNSIYELRDQIAKLNEDFERRKTQFDYEQAKIEWIKWATEIKANKTAEWEAERQERRKQRLREKNKQKGGDGKDAKVFEKDEQQNSKPKINKNQKQIDTCTFLISYVEGLVEPKEEIKKQVTKESSQNLESALKSGEWSKLKGLEVVASKKANVQEQKPVNKKQKKVKKQEVQAGSDISKPTNFIHNIFVQQSFDIAKILPPNKPEDTQEVLKQLNDKLTYFLSNPFGVEKNSNKPTNQKQQKQKYVAGKNKPSTKDRKVINTQEFPSLT